MSAKIYIMFKKAVTAVTIVTLINSKHTTYLYIE